MELLDANTSAVNALIDYLYEEIPGVTIIMSTIIPSRTITVDGAQVASVRDAVNVKYRALAALRIASGDKLVLCDADTFMTTDDIGGDGIHPTEYGYEKLASLFYEAINEAYSQSFLEAPNSSSTADDDTTTADATNNQCAKIYGNGRGPYTDLAGTSGDDDGTYIHNSENMGIIMNLNGNYIEKQTFWTAKLSSLYFDDIIQYVEPGKYLWYANNGEAGFESGHEITVPDKCIAIGVRWADMNGTYGRPCVVSHQAT
jgi:hypothetical protein